MREHLLRHQHPGCVRGMAFGAGDDHGMLGRTEALVGAVQLEARRAVGRQPVAAEDGVFDAVENPLNPRVGRLRTFSIV